MRCPFLQSTKMDPDQIFQVAVISEYVSKFVWDPFSDLRD